ncbi:tetratricopeptide repeat protein [Candidatus Uabimicrobium amorphum]|uniref:Tetratricopeptide repeat domain protein n=1 Tax=Uabimicrobium amorphum TaxID=2596890 RepID=A0A5S9INJ5_UABAM|nr:tetratricopeptide repeat protein [Candidatus Uabimicrobium amorphum]BBM84330.1 tetratricopeptide repeat domain protein [Candidatus Uabimicrobium amorphum]
MDNIGDELSTFTEATSFEQTGDYNAAAEIYQHLVTLEKIKDHSDHSILVDYLNRAGYCYQKSDNVTKSQQCFHEAQSLRQNIVVEKEIAANLDYNPNLYESLSDFDKDFIGKTELELLDLVSKLQGKAKHFVEKKKPNLAAAHYAKLVELAKRLSSISNDDLIKYAENAAFNLQNAKCFRQALYYYTEAVRLNIEEKKFNSIAMNYNNMSFLYLQYQNYTAALKYCQQSLKFNKKINNTYQISLNLSNLGQIYRKQKNFEKALSSFEQAVALKIKLGKRKDIAHEVYHIAEVYRDQEQYKDAIAKINTALSIVSDIETRKISLYNDFLGEIYVKQQQPQTALQYFKKAFRAYSEHSKLKASEVLVKICNVYKEQQDFPNLVTHLEENLHINTELNNEEQVEKLLREIAHVLYKQKEHEQAKEYFSKIIVIHEQKGRAKSFATYYQDLHTLALWHEQLQQYSESFNLLQKALNTAKKTHHGSVEVTLHRIGDVYLIQEDTTRALRAYEQAVEDSNNWYMNALHLIAIAATYGQAQNVQAAEGYHEKAHEIVLQNRKTRNILYLETLKNEDERNLEFKSYYLEAYIHAKMAEFNKKDAIKFHLQAINLLKDICAIDPKNTYENSCQKSRIDIEMNKQQFLIEQINYLTFACAELIEKQQLGVVTQAVGQLFNSNESIYGIEYCGDLLKLCSEIISADQLTDYFFQAGLRYFQLQEYSKSLMSYAKSVTVSQASQDDRQKALQKIVSILEKHQILFDDVIADHLGKCVKIATDSPLYPQLLKSLCLLYKDSENPERGANYFEMACDEFEDKEFTIDLLRNLADRYTALGEKDKVLQVQENISQLEHGEKQTAFLEEIDFEKTQRMAHTFLSLNEYDKALENFTLLEKEHRKQQQKQQLAQTLLYIAQVYGAMGNVKSALENLHEAFTISREINDKVLIGEVLQSMNDVYIKNQDIEGALHYNLSMLDLDRRYGFKPFIVLDLYHISKLCAHKRDFPAAISYAEEALQITNDHKQHAIIDITELLVLLEDLYTQTEHSSKLIDVYMQLISLFEKTHREDMIRTYKDLLFSTCEKYYAKVQNMTSVEKSLENQESLFNAFIYLARTKSKQGLVESSSYEKSVDNLREACQIYQNLKNYVSPRNKHIVYDEMVQCQEGLSQSLLALGDYHMNFETYEDAIFFYAENIEIRKEMNDTQSLIESFLRLANAYQKKRQLQQSLDALLQALKYCQESNFEQEEMRLRNKISQLYLTLGDQEKAYQYSEKVIHFYSQISQTAPLHVNQELLSEAKQVTATIKENTRKQGRDFTLSIEGQLPKSDRS